MTDTGFSVSDADRPRMTALYAHDPASDTAVPYPGVDPISAERPKLLAGGHGLASTAADYHRFTQMLLRRGELDGVRLLAPRTVDLMTANHLPGNATLTEFGRPLLDLVCNEGYGFGLGLSPLVDPIAAKTLSVAGEYRWEGAAGTAFWVDPAADMTVLFFTQVLFGSDDAWLGMRTLVYQALVGGLAAAGREPLAQLRRRDERREVAVVADLLGRGGERPDGDPGQGAADADALRRPRSTISLSVRPRCASTLTGLDTASHTARISSTVRSPGA